MVCPPKFSMAQIHSENENWEAICCKLWNQSSVDQRPCHPAAKGHLKQSSSIIAWEKVCWRTGSPKVQLSTMYFSALIFTLSPQPPCHETPSPSLSAQPWGVEKLLFPRTKYSNNKVQQRWKTITLKNLKCIQASGLWYANNKLQQRTIVDLLSQATFCLLTKKTRKDHNLKTSQRCAHQFVYKFISPLAWWSRLVTKIESLLVAIHSSTGASTNLALSGISWHQIKPSTDRDFGIYPRLLFHKYFHLEIPNPLTGTNWRLTSPWGGCGQ